MAEDAKNPTLTPSENLAVEIARELVAKGYIPVGKQDELKRKISTGTIRQGDWRLYVDLSSGDSRRGNSDEEGG